jgi:predicted lactoylglutathione lyase
MLGDHDVLAAIAVKTLAAARKFYEGKLNFGERSVLRALRHAGGDAERRHSSCGKLKNAWFKDPDGNVLALVGQ